MKKYLLPLAVAALLLTGCAPPDEPAVSTTTATSTTVTTSSSATSSSSTTSPAPTTTDQEPTKEPAPVEQVAPVEQPTPAEVAELYVVECLFGTPGPSLMSDGTIQSTDYCANQPGAQEYRDAEADAGYDPNKNYENPQLPAYLTRTPEESRQQAEGQGWWGDCMASNSAEYCRANDPYQ